MKGTVLHEVMVSTIDNRPQNNIVVCCTSKAPPGDPERALFLSHCGYAECWRNGLCSTFDARNLCALDAETGHESLLIKNEGISIIL